MCSSAAGCSAARRILIHGGTSGIGTTAIQLARRVRRARVRHRRQRTRSARACERLGAERGRQLPHDDWVAAVREATDGRGVDVILDMVGGDYVGAQPRRCWPSTAGWCRSRSSRAAKRRARLSMQVMRRRLTITGSTLRPRTPSEKGAIAARAREQVWPLLESRHGRAGRFTQTFPLADAADAHRMMEASTSHRQDRPHRP